MLKAECDECHKPIAPSDDHIEIAQMVIVDKKEGQRFQGLHLCGKGCLCKYLDKVATRPLLVGAQNGN